VPRIHASRESVRLFGGWWIRYYSLRGAEAATRRRFSERPLDFGGRIENWFRDFLRGDSLGGGA